MSETQETRINVRILLAALRRFYDHLISSKIYEPPTAKLVRRYFDDDANGRRAHDRQGFALRIWGIWTLPIWRRSDCF